MRSASDARSRAAHAGGRDRRRHRAVARSARSARRHDGAARGDQLQTSTNPALGSGGASLGQTVPAVAAIAWWTGAPLALRVSAGGAVPLALSVMTTLINDGMGRASLRSGLVHVVLMATWLFLVVVP
jgi:Ca2+:H+ antiporter